MGMKWPWVSRRAFDLLVAERDGLLVERARLFDSLLRITRHEAGMPELERQPRKNDLKPMPAELQEHFRGWMDGKLGLELRGRAYRRHAQGEPWESIMKSILEPENPQTAGG